MLKAKRRIRLPRSDRPAVKWRGIHELRPDDDTGGQEVEHARRSQFAFGLGTVGRNMLSPLVSRCFIYYLADVLDLPDETMWTITGVLTLRWIFDAVKDPLRKGLVDKTKTRRGWFRPWFGPDEPGRS